MHKTTLNLETGLYIRLRNLAETEGSTVSELVNSLLVKALEKGPAGYRLLLMVQPMAT
jgi:predicted DNA-binding ribbon-helix-helix protein